MSWYSSKFILVTKKGIYKNDKFYSIFLGVQQRDFDRALTSQNEATALLNKDGPERLRKAWKFA